MVVILFQVLKVVNPDCTFSNGKQTIPGVAVILKELLPKLDELGVEHMEEASIRRDL